MCGVFLCFVLLGCHASETTRSSSLDLLRIGYSEGTGDRSSSGGAGQIVEALSLEGLTRVDTDGRTVGRIATEWKWADEGLTLKVQLRSDVVLHDGKPLDSERAVEILKPLIADKDNHALFTSLANVIGIEPDGKFGILLKLSHYSSYLPEDLSVPFSTSPDPPTGIGPYQNWEWSQDGLTLTLHLRPDVTLDNGRTLDSELAVRTLKPIVADKNIHGLFTSLASVTGIEPHGTLGLVVKLSRQESQLPKELSFPFRTSSDPPIGTGPYRIVQRSDSEIVFERFEKYYLGRPTIARVIVSPMGTLRNTWTSFLRGNIDMVNDLPPGTVELVGNDDTQVLSFARPYQYLIAFNSRTKKFSNHTVRRAINLGVDRNAIVTKVLHGDGMPATSPIWPKHWAYDTTVEPFPFDKREATRLLDSLGLAVRPSSDPSRPSSRLSFTCILPEGFSNYERVSLELQRQLYGIGVDLHFDVMPFREYNKRIRSGDFEAAFIDMISAPSLGRPYLFWRSARGGIGYNMFGYENEEAESLFQAIRAATNDAVVRTATHRLQRVFMEDPPAIFLAWNERSRAVNAKFGAWSADPKADPLLSLWRWGADKQNRTLAAR